MIATAFAAGAEGHAEPFYLAAEFWVLVSFVVFFALLWRRMQAMIGGALDARAAAIRREIDEARELREQAQAALADFERKRQDAARQSEEFIALARAEARNAAARASAELMATLARREQLALDLIAQAEAKVVDELRAETASLAIQAARSLIAQTLKDTAAARLIDAAIAEIPQKLH